MNQRLIFDSVSLNTSHSEDRPYVIAGTRMYAIGMMSGAAPRIGDEHLVGEMGGLWAHPFKALDAWGFALSRNTLKTSNIGAKTTQFDGAFWKVTRTQQAGALVMVQTEWIDEDNAVMHASCSVTNSGDSKIQSVLRFNSVLSLRNCWMSTQLAGTARIKQQPEMISAVLSTAPARAVIVLADGPLRRTLKLAPGASHDMHVVIAASNTGGVAEARIMAERALREHATRAKHKHTVYLRSARHTHASADPALAAAFTCARANLKLLETRNLAGHYAIAGLPEYPNLFGCDTTYSIAGLCAAGRADLAKDALRALAAVANRQCGRVPHEVIPDGNVFNPGNTQETPQFVIAVEQVYAHEPALPWLLETYPICRAALLSYLRTGFTWQDNVWGGSKFPHYPFGNAMVEREGMLPLKLDATCYTWQALNAFVRMAETLAASRRGAHLVDPSDIKLARTWARNIKKHFERDWWIEKRGLYADSLDWDGKQQHAGHWTQIVPLETGLASPTHARQVLTTVKTKWLGPHGLPHTHPDEPRVWTLPCALLARAAVRLGDTQLALRLLGNIASTLHTRQLGMYEELIPQGLCFVQLWSAALFVEIFEAAMMPPRRDRR